MYIYPEDFIFMLYKKVYNKDFNPDNLRALFPVMSYHKSNKGFDIIKEEKVLRNVSSGINF